MLRKAKCDVTQRFLAVLMLVKLRFCVVTYGCLEGIAYRRVYVMSFVPKAGGQDCQSEDGENYSAAIVEVAVTRHNLSYVVDDAIHNYETLTGIEQELFRP